MCRILSDAIKSTLEFSSTSICLLLHISTFIRTIESFCFVFFLFLLLVSLSSTSSTGIIHIYIYIRMLITFSTCFLLLFSTSTSFMCFVVIEHCSQVSLKITYSICIFLMLVILCVCLFVCFLQEFSIDDSTPLNFFL